MKTKKTHIAALLLLLPSFCIAQSLPLTTNRCSFPGYAIEITVNQQNWIQQFKIVDTDAEPPKILYEKSSFADWSGAVGYYGIIQTGDRFCLITEATGTGVAQYYVHEYRVRERFDVLTASRCIYYWTDLESQGGLHLGARPSVTWEHNTNDLWQPYITLNATNVEHVVTRNKKKSDNSGEPTAAAAASHGQ